MKTGLYICALLFAVCSMAETTTDKPKPIQTGQGHTFACTDYSGKKVFIVDKNGNVEWEYNTPGNCNDLWVLPNGNLLFNTGHGVREVNREKEIVFEYNSKSEIFACQRLPNGDTFIGECSSAKLLEVQSDGKVVKEINLLPDGKKGGHAFMRNARKLPNGNYLVAHYGSNMVKEYDADGKVIREIPSPGGPHSAARLKNGNIIIAEGDKNNQPRVWEVDPDGNTVWEVKHDELPNISLKFMTGFQRLPNGNTVMSNWVGHDQFGKAPHIIEVTPAKKVVWTFDDHKTMRTVSNIQVLDVPGDATTFELIH